MLVLRLTIHGKPRDLRFEQARVVLGSGLGSDVREADIGWASEEATLLHRGTEVELRRPGGEGGLRLRVGDSVRLGHARLELVGLLPLDGVAASAAGDEAPATAPLVFGGYEEGLAGGTPTFEIADDPQVEAPPPEPKIPPKRTEPPPPKRPTPEPRPATQPTRGAAPPKPQPQTMTSARPTAKPPEERASVRGTPPLPRPPAPAFRQPDFGEELVRQIKRAPFFVLSVAVHALVFLALTVIESHDVAGTQQDDDGSLRATVNSAAEEQDIETDEGEFPPIPDMPALPEIPEVDLEVDIESREDPEGGEVLEALPNNEPLPFEIGTAPSLRSVDAGTGRTQKRLSPKELKQTFSKGDAPSANRKAADYIRSQIGRGAGRRGDPLQNLARTDLLVVEGTFDKIGLTLKALQLPFATITPGSLAKKNAPDLSRHKVIFWNCGESLPPEQLRVAVRRLRTFVKNGGFLFTTDWSIGNVIALAFPGYVMTSGPRAPLPETVIDIRPGKGRSSHKLLRGVFRPGVQGRWWLEQASFDIRVLKPDDVTVLIESPDLEQIFRRQPAVAVTFRYGRGQVLHVMGHYYQEAGNMAGTISAQRLALNFVLERVTRD